MQDNDKSGIYCIENKITNKKYIGQSIHVFQRWNKHKSELNNNRHFNDYLQKAWKKYGSENFVLSVLEYCEPDELDDKEIYYIELYNTTNRNLGYNIQYGGQDNRKHSEETRKKLSESIKKSYLNPERREIQSINALNQWRNPEIKKKISGENNYMYGKHHTEEAKQKMRDAATGRKSYRRNTTPVLCIDLNRKFDDATEAGKAMSLDSSAILKVCQGKRKTCGKYKWKFLIDGE